MVEGEPKERILGFRHIPEVYNKENKILEMNFGRDIRVHKTLMNLEALPKITSPSQSQRDTRVLHTDFGYNKVCPELCVQYNGQIGSFKRGWRGVTLLSVPSKIFCKVIIQRITKAVDDVLRDEQAGFRKGRRCADQIFTLRNILEQCSEWNRQLYVNFID